MTFKKSALLAFIIFTMLVSFCDSQANEENATSEEIALNIANPDTHPYVTAAAGREGREHAEALVNEARVYGFYGRQADHYMAGEARPKLVAAFPGLDAGVHGHWGKHNQNQYEDGRWNDIKMGSLRAQTFTHKTFSIAKGISLKLPGSGLSTCFDPVSVTFPIAWHEGFIVFDPFRWGTARNAFPDGEIFFEMPDRGGWTRDGRILAIRYRGLYRHEDEVVFSFDLGGSPMLCRASATGAASEAVFSVTFEFPEGFAGALLGLGPLPEDSCLAHLSSSDESRVTLFESRQGIPVLDIPALDGPGRFVYSIGPPSIVTKHAKQTIEQSLQSLAQGGPPQWPDRITTKGERAPDNKPYVIDTLTVPEDTGFESVMQLTSVAFLPDGIALLATLAGEIWKVDGIDEDLNELTWKRFAAGLHQPIGLHIDDDGIFVMERGQITRLHDLNGDNEADFYENYANDFDARVRSHTHSFGLVRDSAGAFYFVNWKDILRTSPDRQTQHYAFGVRNCMGVGTGAEGTFLVGPQEGTFTPTSMAIEVNEGEFYGHPGDSPGATISPPLCFIPRGIDNSTGGFLYADSKRWGPLFGNTVGFSYGYATHYLVLRDDSTNRAQGAVVPLEGDFRAGVMRGAFSPIDGQLYVTGIDGWGDYSISDGCFQRVRYTGKKLRQPIDFQVHKNGIRVDFSTSLDPSASGSARNFFAQQWNYEYSDQYGSPEYSANNPESLGHDVLEVRSATVLDSGNSIFIEIPEIEPVMQLHLRMHLRDIDGTHFKADLFPTIVELGERVTDASDLAPPVSAKPSTLTLREKRNENANQLVTRSGESVEGERTISLECSSALKFASDLIEAKVGEPLKLVFTNPDIMPHNVIFVTEGNLQKVGDLSFSMLNDPKAAEKHYTPNVAEVIAGTFLVQPNGEHTLHFTAPLEPGNHHFVCTFPGHWMTMNGVFRVTE
ncbi:MAG: DUF6797 domain-containing protein [Verrucomicrobiota bacterium]